MSSSNLGLSDPPSPRTHRSEKRVSGHADPRNHRPERRDESKHVQTEPEQRRGSLYPQEKEGLRQSSGRTHSAPVIPGLRSRRKGPVAPASPRREHSFDNDPVPEAHSDVKQEVNIAVLGHAGVGKSTLITRIVDLPDVVSEDACSCTITPAGTTFLVRFFEMAIKDVYEDENKALNWPPAVRNYTIHGVMTLYDVGNKASFRLVPEALRKSSPLLPLRLD